MKRKNGGSSKRKALKGTDSGLVLFYAVCALATAVLLLGLGVSVAQRFSARNIDGSFPELIYSEDILRKIREVFC